MPKTIIEHRCVHCGKIYKIRVHYSDYDGWINGKGRIQDLMPYLSPDDRELMISGTCGPCFDKIFGAER